MSAAARVRKAVIQGEPPDLAARDPDYRVLLRVGSIEAGGVVRITEWTEGREIAWASGTGVDTAGRWTLEPRGAATRLCLEIRFDLPPSMCDHFRPLLAGNDRATCRPRDPSTRRTSPRKPTRSSRHRR